MFYIFSMYKEVIRHIIISSKNIDNSKQGAMKLINS